MTLYMAVTPDKYELPMLIAESKAELARMTGMQFLWDIPSAVSPISLP